MRVKLWVTLATNTSTYVPESGGFFAGLDTNASVNDDASNVTVGGTEPTSSNGYARQSFTWNTSVATPALDAAAIVLNVAAISWTSSGGGFSTAATTLKVVPIWNTSTLATITEAAFVGRCVMATPRAVDVTGITLTIAIGGLQMGMISN